MVQLKEKAMRLQPALTITLGGLMFIACSEAEPKQGGTETQESETFDELDELDTEAGEEGKEESGEEGKEESGEEGKEESGEAAECNNPGMTIIEPWYTTPVPESISFMFRPPTTPKVHQP